MARSNSAMSKLLVKSWCGQGEQLVYLFGDAERDGYVASSTGGRTLVPHVVTGEAVRVAASERNDRAPMSELAGGNFVGDELVHDPGLWAWAQAGTPDATAVRFADQLAAGGQAARLAITSHRVAVVVDADSLVDPEPASEVPSSLLGKAKSVVQSVQQRSADGPPVTTCCEAELRSLRGVEPVPMGRGGMPVWFFGVHFADGSRLLCKHAEPAQLVETIRLNAR